MALRDYELLSKIHHNCFAALEIGVVDCHTEVMRVLPLADVNVELIRFESDGIIQLRVEYAVHGFEVVAHHALEDGCQIFIESVEVNLVCVSDQDSPIILRISDKSSGLDSMILLPIPRFGFVVRLDLLAEEKNTDTASGDENLALKQHHLAEVAPYANFEFPLVLLHVPTMLPQAWFIHVDRQRLALPVNNVHSVSLLIKEDALREILLRVAK